MQIEKSHHSLMERLWTKWVCGKIRKSPDGMINSRCLLVGYLCASAVQVEVWAGDKRLVYCHLMVLKAMRVT